MHKVIVLDYNGNSGHTEPLEVEMTLYDTITTEDVDDTTTIVSCKSELAMNQLVEHIESNELAMNEAMDYYHNNCVILNPTAMVSF